MLAEPGSARAWSLGITEARPRDGAGLLLALRSGCLSSGVHLRAEKHNGARFWRGSSEAATTPISKS